METHWFYFCEYPNYELRWGGKREGERKRIEKGIGVGEGTGVGQGGGESRTMFEKKGKKRERKEGEFGKKRSWKVKPK